MYKNLIFTWRFLFNIFRDKPPKTQFLSLNFSTTAQKRVLNASTVTEFVVGPQHDKITKVVNSTIYLIIKFWYIIKPFDRNKSILN